VRHRKPGARRLLLLVEHLHDRLVFYPMSLEDMFDVVGYILAFREHDRVCVTASSGERLLCESATGKLGSHGPSLFFHVDFLNAEVFSTVLVKVARVQR